MGSKQLVRSSYTNLPILGVVDGVQPQGVRDLRHVVLRSRAGQGHELVGYTYGGQGRAKQGRAGLRMHAPPYTRALRRRPHKGVLTKVYWEVQWAGAEVNSKARKPRARRWCVPSGICRGRGGHATVQPVQRVVQSREAQRQAAMSDTGSGSKKCGSMPHTMSTNLSIHHCGKREVEVKLKRNFGCSAHRPAQRLQIDVQDAGPRPRVRRRRHLWELAGQRVALHAAQLLGRQHQRRRRAPWQHSSGRGQGHFHGRVAGAQAGPRPPAVHPCHGGQAHSCGQRNNQAHRRPAGCPMHTSQQRNRPECNSGPLPSG